jgi:hypothetical protein
MRRIPLRARDGRVRAYALVDDGDYEELSRHRWHLNTNGYARRAEYGRVTRRIYMHQQVMGLVGIDHADGNRLNNQRSNLRSATKSENAQNVRGGRGSSKYRGVSFHRAARKWEAHATLDGRKIYLGLHATEAAAAAAAAAYRAEHMPFSRAYSMISGG